MLTEEDFKDPAHFIAMLNQINQNYNQVLNELLGFSGTVKFNAPLDLQGNRIINTGSPVAPTDVITKIIADAAYSAPVLRPQLEATGAQPLQTYRQLSNPIQQETNSSWLNTLAHTAPSANTSTVTFGAPSGGFVPVTISAGIFTRADGTNLPYPQYNDSLALPTTFPIDTLVRAGGVVTGATIGVNTLIAGETISISGAGDAGFNGSFALTFAGISGSPPAQHFTFNQSSPNASTSGGTISLFGIYYYCLKPALGKLFRVGPYQTDSTANRINSQKDGSMIIAVVSVNGAGGDITNTAAGSTSPAENAGANPRILAVL